MAEAPLYAAFVTRDNALRYCRGVLSAPELWATAAIEKNSSGRCLFINGLRGKFAWRTLAQICSAIPPEQMVFASRIPSIVKRCGQFGAQLMRCESLPDGTLWFYFAEGEPLRAFLDAICRQRGEQ